MNNIHFRRHGDINLYPITKKEYEAIQGELIKSNGKFVVQEGETTGHKHVLTIDPSKMEIKKMPNGLHVFCFTEEGVLTHEDHKKIKVAPVYYKEVREREADHFADSIIRQVID